MLKVFFDLLREKRRGVVASLTSFRTSRKLVVEAVVQRCSMKKVFLDISQNSRENTCARAFFSIQLHLWWLENV